MSLKFDAVMACDFPGCNASETIEAEAGFHGPVARVEKFYAKGWGYKVPTEVVEGDMEWKGLKTHYKFNKRKERQYFCPEHHKVKK